MMEAITLVKIGGHVIDDEAALGAFLDRFARLAGPKILVHGGGKLATRTAQRLGIPTQMVDGRRITDPATLEVVTMVYAGLINKRIVARLQALGCDALGLSGADGGLIRARRRAPQPVDYGEVGDIEAVDDARLAQLLAAGMTPVCCSIVHDGRGALLNCNADSVATALALGASRHAATDLVFCFEKRGVLRDVEDDASLIPQITAASFAALRDEGVVSQGMLPKIENALKAVAGGVRSVAIRRAEELLDPESGTLIR